MPDTPAWAARAALYVVVGVVILLGIPFAGWLGKREIRRWEEKVDDLETKIDELEGENESLRSQVMELQYSLMGDHEDVESKLDTLIDKVQD